MERKRWSGTLMMAVVAVVLGCNPSTPPTAPNGSETPLRRTKSSAAPSKAPASAAPLPTATPSASGQPSTSPVTSPTASTASTTPASASPSASPSVGPSVVPTSLSTPNPTLAALGCKPAGAEVPVAVGAGGVKPLVAAVYGHGAVPALNVTRGASSVAIKPPAPVDVVLTAHPGGPAARITAYEVSFLAGEGTTTAVGAITRFSIPAVDLPAAPATHFGRPVAVPVVLPVGQLKDALASAATAPTVIRAEVRFFDAAGNGIQAKTLDPLIAKIPLPLGATAGAADLPTAEACGGASPTPFVPEPLVPGAGIDTAVAEWREVSPLSVVRSAAGVLSQTNVGIALAGPPGSTGARIDSIEAVYEFTTEADNKAGKPATKIGPVVTNLTPPVVVAAGTETAYGPSAFATLPFADASLTGLKGAEGVVVVTFTFKNKETGTINGADGDPLKVTIPIQVE